MWSPLPQTFGPILHYNQYQTLYISRKFVWILDYSALFYTLLNGLSARWTPSRYSPLHVPHWLWSLILTTYSLLFPPPPPPMVPFLPFTYQYHIRHSSPHTKLIFLPNMVFKCRHSIRNQSVSTAIPSPSSFHHITTIRKHKHLGKILTYVFSYVF